MPASHRSQSPTDWLSPRSPEDERLLLRESSLVCFTRGQTIFSPTEKPRSVFGLERGLVRIYRLGEAGAEVTLGYVGKGEVFGELGAFGDHPRESFAVAALASTVRRFTRRGFDQLVSGSPDRVMRVTRQIARRLKPRVLRSQINVVLQDTLLLRRSVRDNIAFGRPEASLEEVVAAARAAQIHDFVASLPEGYDTMLSDKARDLSGGQRQRLALARAILREAPILILDEPVSAVDAITEARLDQTLARVSKGRTALIVAHRLATIRRADLILVIEEGRVAEQGTHAELIASSGRYRALYETQYQRPAAERRTGTDGS